jgi:DNA-binding SARP family transcriptional activator
VDGEAARDRTFDVSGDEASRRARGHTDEGIVLVEPSGNLLWWSPAMTKALERAGARWWRGMRCCEAFGCRDDCLTQRTLGTGGEPEARHWSAGAGIDAAITARPIRCRGQELVVVEVRFLAAAMTVVEPPPRDVKVSALGPLSVTVGGRPRDGDWLQQRPGQVFRYLLASRASAQRSEAIASALWPDRGPSAVANVRYCIFKLREQLADSGDLASSLVIRDAAGYRVDLRRVDLDVDRFQEKTSAGIAAQRRGESDAAEPVLMEAMALYRGDFLGDDPYADWAFSEREYLRSMAGKNLAALAQIGLSTGRLVSAAEHLQRLAQLEPFDSHVHQMLIEVCLRRGRRTEALRHYHALRARLHRAFGEQPDFDLTSLAAGLAVRKRERRDLSRRIAAGDAG